MIVFMTNYLNIHQLPFTLKMREILGEEFVFLSMSGITKARLAIGFEDLDTKYSFVVRAYTNNTELEKAINIANSCEVLIAGSVEDNYLFPRLNAGKLTFRYSERYFKSGYGIRAFLSAMKHIKPFEKYDSYYYLCSSAYTATDLNKYTKFIDKTYKWGYFPEIKNYPNLSKLIDSKNHNSILWCGRMIDWKHPEVAVFLANRLLKDKIDFSMKIIGNGSEFDKVSELIKRYGLQENIEMLGSLPPEKVREYMEASEIYIFTSDRNEGWGAVLNEAMNSACAVVANHQIGAVPFLIMDGDNGFIYLDDDEEDLYKKVRILLENNVKRRKMAARAYGTIINTWNGTVAAERLVDLIRKLKFGENKEIPEYGPCSKASILQDDWYKGGNSSV